MPRERNAVKAGVFLVATVVAVVAVVLAIRGSSHLFDAPQTRTIRFAIKDDIAGLTVGDPVRVGGFTVGNVQKIELANTDVTPAPNQPSPALINVTFTMPHKYTLHEGAIVRVQSTLTGSTWLNFEDVGSGPPLAETAYIQGTPSVLNGLEEGLASALPTVQHVLTNVDTNTIPAVNDDLHKLGEAAAAAKPLIMKASAVADNANTTVQNVSRLSEDLRTGTVANTCAITAGVKQKLPDLLDRLSVVLTEVHGTLDKAHDALEEARGTLVHTRALAESARSVVGGNKGKLDGMIDSLKTASDNFKQFTAGIENSPWRLIYKPAPREIANLNLYDATRQFAEGAASLRAASESLRDAAKDPTTTPEKLNQLQADLDTRFAGFKKVENELWSQVKQ